MSTFKIKKKITLNYPKSAAMGFCSKGFKSEFQTDPVNEPSVFEPLKFYCISIFCIHFMNNIVKPNCFIFRTITVIIFYMHQFLEFLQ